MWLEWRVWLIMTLNDFIKARKEAGLSVCQKAIEEIKFQLKNGSEKSNRDALNIIKSMARKDLK